MSMTTDIEKLVRSLNQAWMESRYDDLYQYFHPDVAIESHTYTGVVICHLTFNVDYEIDSGRFTDSGVETYAIDITGTHPKVVWRSQATVESSDT